MNMIQEIGEEMIVEIAGIGDDLHREKAHLEGKGRDLQRDIEGGLEVLLGIKRLGLTLLQEKMSSLA